MKTLRGLLARFKGVGQLPKTEKERTYAEWIDLYSSIGQEERDHLTKLQNSIPELPKISILIDAAQSARQDIEVTIRSVEEQIYTNWDVVVVFPPEEFRTEGGSISVVSFNAHEARTPLEIGLKRATGQIIILINAGDKISPQALTAVAWTFAHFPSAAALYSDQDTIDKDGRRVDPWCKGDWSPDQALAQGYTLRLGAFRRETLTIASAISESKSLTAGFYAVWVLLASRDEPNIIHLPMVLYHRKQQDGDTDPKVFTTIVRSVLRAEELDLKVESIPGCGWRRILRPIPAPLPRITLCIPTRDRADLLSKCVDGLLHRTDWPDLEVIIADNGSVEPETLDYFRAAREDPRVKVIRHDGEFNFSRLNNIGASHASGLLFGLINNDLVVRDPDWLRIMASHAVRPTVGAVGALLYYGDDTIQHTGVVLGIGGVASHIHKRLPMGKPGYHGRAIVTQELSSVTGACLLTRLDLYRELGGLDEAAFPVAYNDIDFCLKVRSRNLRVILAPDAQLYHLESVSRGLDNDPVKRARLDRDKALMKERWNQILADDPFYNPNLSLTATDCRLAWPPRARRPWSDQFHKT